MKSSTYALMAVGLLMLAVIFHAAGFSYLRAKAFPVAIAGIVLLLVLVELAKDIRGRQPGKLAYEKEKKVEQKDLGSKYLVEGCWLAGFCLGVYLLGFILALPLFGISYLVLHGRSWGAATAVGLSTAVVLYILFFYLLGVGLYPGVILQNLGW